MSQMCDVGVYTVFLGCCVVAQVGPASQVTKATKDSLGYLAVLEEMAAQASQGLQVSEP